MIRFLFSALLILLPTAVFAAGSGPTVAAEGTEFKVTMPDGKVLRSRDLAGAVLTIATGGQTLRLRIDAVERDPDATRGDVWLHTLTTPQPDGSWKNICKPGPDGRMQSFPLAGRARIPDGLFEAAEPQTFELTCTAGAQGKCVRFGYFPWEGTEQLALYNSCVRMVRADYCGDGEPHTRDGTKIDLYDTHRIQKDEPLPGGEFEAGWSPMGAVCVQHVRIKDISSLNALAQKCARLADRIGTQCSEDQARSLGAVLFNRSFP